MGIIGPHRRPLTPNREKERTDVCVFDILIAGRLKCDKNEEFLYAIRGRGEGRPDWRMDARDFLNILRKSTAARWVSQGPSS